MMKDSAILITTFLRDDLLFRCIDSIRKYYKDIPIFVGDNGESSDEKDRFCKNHRCKLLKLGFDLGVAETRNASLRLIPKDYKYITIVEDDIIFTEGTKLESLLKILKAERDVGIASCLTKRSLIEEEHYEANIWFEGNTYYIQKVDNPPLKEIDGTRYYFYDLVQNVFMMKRNVWEKVKWDPQFKTAFEHSDFFLRLKYRQDKNQLPIFKDGKPVLRERPIKAVYTPDVWMLHKHGIDSPRYIAFRQRPKGWELFADKWKVEFSISSFNSINPVRLSSRGMGYDVKDENLGLAIRILEKHGCRWWLEAGTCLGAVRNANFINNDPDIDLGLFETSLPLWEAFIKEFKEAGFELYKEWMHEGKRMELSFRRKGVKLDLFFFFKHGDRLWHGAFGPDDAGRWGENMKFLPHIFSAKLFENLKEVVFRAKRCSIPNPPEQYLLERYGKNWKIPNPNYKYWKDCQAIDRNFFKAEKIVFIGGVWDLFHIGHLNILEKSKALGARLIVGVLTDEAARRYKPRPVVPFEQRKRIIEALRISGQVIEQNDSDPTEDLKRLGIRPDYLIHGDDWDSCPGEAYVRTCGGKLVLLAYTKGISSSEMRKKMDVAEEKSFYPLDGKIAIGIKTFLREKSLFRTLDAIKKNIGLPYKLYIADDGKVSPEKEFRYQQLEREGHEIIRLPYNCGISAGRNAIVKIAGERFILIMDDDIEIEDSKSIKNMLKILDGDDELGLAAGTIEHENGEPFGSSNYTRGIKFKLEDGILFRWPSKAEMQKVDGVHYTVADQVVNFFIARKEIFSEVRWDERIKVEWEHMDFFLNLAKTKWKAAVCLDAKAVHIHSENEPEYNEARRSGVPSYFFQKHGISNVINRFQ